MTTIAWHELQSTQFARALEHVRYAYQKSEFYRSRYDAAGIHPDDLRTLDDFIRVPMVSKLEVTLDQEASPPFGTQRIEEAGELARVFCTAGSFYIGLTASDLEALERMFADMFEVLGVRAGDLVDIASSYHWVVAGTVFDAALRGLGAGVVPAGPGLSELRLRTLARLGVSVLQAFTPYAEELASSFAQRGIEPQRDLNVRLLIIGGELRSEDARQRLQRAWGGAAVRELYGVSEIGMTGAECEAERGMHVSEQCYLEVADPDTGQPVDAGVPGEVVMTELARRAQPFIRFRTGDITEGLITEPCSCGLTTPRLGRIIGRQSEVLRVRGQFLSPIVMRELLARFPEVGQWQVVIDRPGRIDTLKLEIAPKAGAEISGEVVAAIQSSARGVMPLTLEVVTVEGGLEPVQWYDDRRQMTGSRRS